MKPTKETIFKPISELANYSNKDEWFCSAVVFSPETENDHFTDCQPYIRLSPVEYNSEGDVFFEVPEIVAYYAKTHPCYTMKGIEENIKRGERKMAQKIKALLEIK